MNFRRPLKQNWGEKTDRVHWNKGKNFMLTYRLHTEFDNQMLRECSYSPICWHGWPLPHEWLGKEQPPHCQPGLLSAWDSFLQGIQHKDMIKMYQEKKKKHYVDWGSETAPVVASGASALLPLWISCAAKLFSSNEVPFTTGTSSSNGFTEASEDTVMYCRASQRAVLPSWSFSSRSSLDKVDKSQAEQS